MKVLWPCLLFLAALPAQAYEFTRTDDGQPIHWASWPVTYRINAASLADAASDVVEEEVKAAFDAWNEVCCAAVSLKKGTATDVGGAAGLEALDGQNGISWEETEWDMEPSVLAYTQVLFTVTDGVIAEADILFNGVTYRWGAEATGAFQDIRHTLTHEVGHLLGLDDVYDPVMEQATMYGLTSPGYMNKRSLEEDDRLGLCELYPAPDPDGACEGGLLCQAGLCVDPNAPPPSQEEDGGGCSLAPGPGAILPLSLLLLLLPALRRRGQEP